MADILTAKFTYNPELADKLVATTGRLLVEGNTWHDQTWGNCTCDGTISLTVFPAVSISRFQLPGIGR